MTDPAPRPVLLFFLPHANAATVAVYHPDAPHPPSSEYHGTPWRIASQTGARSAQHFPALWSELYPVPPVPEPRPWHAIVCAVGPGSFTGIRLAAAVTQALAMRYQVPVIALPQHAHCEQIQDLLPAALLAWENTAYTAPAAPIPLHLGNPYSASGSVSL